MKLSSQEILLLARIIVHAQDGTRRTIREVNRRSGREYDLEIKGNAYKQHDVVSFYQGWLPVFSIGWLLAEAVVDKFFNEQLPKTGSSLTADQEKIVWEFFSSRIVNL